VAKASVRNGKRAEEQGALLSAEVEYSRAIESDPSLEPEIRPSID